MFVGGYVQFVYIFLLLCSGSQTSEVVFSFGSVPRLLPEGEEVRCYLLSERPHKRGIILEKSTRIARG
jgi:hypothetical protein